MRENAAPTKKTYGGCDVFRVQATPPDLPTAINMYFTFEDAMKLHLALQDALLHINSFNRSTRDGKAAGVNVCLFPARRRITVVPASLKEPRQP
jgi:hypothetical protein